MKKSYFSPLVLVLGLLVSVFPAGCAKQDVSEGEPKADPAPVVEVDPFEEFLVEFDELAQASQTNEMVQLCRDALENDALSDNHVDIYVDLIRLYFLQGNIEEAKASIDAELKKEDSLLLSQGLPAFLSQYAEAVELTDYEAYCDELLAKDISDSQKTSVWRSLAWVYLSHTSLDRFTARLDDMETSIDPTNFAPLLNMVLGQAIRSSQFEQVDALIAKVNSIESMHSRTDVADALRRHQADLLLSRGALEDAEKFLTANAEKFSDNAFSSFLVTLINNADKKGNTEMLKRLSIFTFKLGENKTLSRNQAALAWARLPSRKSPVDNRLFLERVALLITSDIDPMGTFRLYQRHYYAIMKDASPALRNMCVDVGLQISALDIPWEEVDQNMMQLLLDGTFYMRDFKKSLEILNAGIPGKEPEWHEMLINKVSAHIAEEEGRYGEAIKRYRTHMDSVKEMEDLANPETQRIVIVESVLAYNEKRIGDLHKKNGEADMAASAYKRARDLYGIALKKAEPGSPDALEIQQELNNVPQDDS